MSGPLLRIRGYGFCVVVLGVPLLTLSASVGQRPAQDSALRGGSDVALPPPCTSGRKYAAAVVPIANLTGSSAKIRTRSTKLCGESIGYTTLATSAAWTGVTLVPATKWAQLGYVRRRPPQSTTIIVSRYVETRFGTGVNGIRRYYFTSVPGGTKEYKCYMFAAGFGTWKYFWDGIPLFTTPDHAGWRNLTAARYDYTGEILNKESDMAGTASAKCDFTECKYTLSYNGGGFVNANIQPGNLYNDDVNEWGAEHVSTTAINIWDKNPLP